MATSAPGYLHDCLAAFPEVSARKYGTPFDLAAIERNVRRLRSAREPLTYKDLSYFVSPEHWWFEKFWVFPAEDKITPKLARTRFDFWNLPRNQAVVLERLLDVFKSIELVSIILRFVKPEAYGIISPPVERVLDVRRGGDAVETYTNYLRDLAAIQAHYGFARAADVDMALWVLHERCYGTLRDQRTLAAFAADPFMLRLRAQNLVGDLLTGDRYAQFAEALEHVNPQLAAVVACYTFELQLRNLARELGSPGDAARLTEVIAALPLAGPVTELRKGNWKRLKGWRDALFHRGMSPTPEQSRALVREVRLLEDDIASLRAAAATRG
ncbi:MAG TPA: hypothetical protein VGU22_07310 [Methylomirabilota bacterium]|jgi:hypothetical protein|nr:hypothetical protein [Methylomirabilota bacterium]